MAEETRSLSENTMVWNIITPLTLRDSIPYKTWKKKIRIWQKFTQVKPDKQALGIFLSLERKAREAVAELDKLYLKDKFQLA